MAGLPPGLSVRVKACTHPSRAACSAALMTSSWAFSRAPRPGTSSQVTEKLFLSRSDSLNLLIMKVSSPRPLYFNWPIKALFSILAIPAMRMNG